jgi:hypothetical protein
MAESFKPKVIRTFWGAGARQNDSQTFRLQRRTKGLINVTHLMVIQLYIIAFRDNTYIILHLTMSGPIIILNNDLSLLTFVPNFASSHPGPKMGRLSSSSSHFWCRFTFGTKVDTAPKDNHCIKLLLQGGP